MKKPLDLTVEEDETRLDVFVSGRCGISRSYAQKLIDLGDVSVNGRSAKPSRKVVTGDRVSVTLPSPQPPDLAPEDIPLTVVYEDGDVIVIDKPAGLVVHPTAGQRTGTLVNALLARCPDLGGIDGMLRPGIVHRLDKDTSGLMVVAKNDAAHASLSRQIKRRAITKAYIVLVVGHLSPESGAIEAPIGRSPSDRKRMGVVSGGKEARTQYQVIRYPNGHTLLEAILETGRTHQIRVHFSAIGHPVLGDPVYGKKSKFLGRQFLHAHRLGFRLPSSGEYVEFTSSLPADLQEALVALSYQRTS
jgi:23S rRNA pseudouridine1911/1915/1917 synthase